ncbi:MFS transporter [Amycolatopsis azurea]|uniref:MFS transporter n=1 Tax=Amycolatopsis azurea DSM 43854 TaxID=1238180 RepID=M2NTZ4_9PSEU|nr:MFS transporter [Amycolatopsis azurea]EMD25944.1 major facilitator superfamily MFS_1 [Amycolatopsis azurea DSM 43854]OOC01780.1 MFS transporter [Amycolatopsis azurea DSM 43854]
MKPMFALFMGVACLSTAVVGLSTTAALIVVDHAGAAWSGLPNAVLVLGSAVGSLSSGALAARYGRRLVLVLMYGAAVIGALVSFAGVLGGSVLALVAGMPLIGFGNSGAQLSRYTAADLAPERRKGFALSTMVWAGTVGAVAGPALIAPAAARAEAAELPALSGPIAAGAVVVALAVVAVVTLPRNLAAPVERAPRRERMSVRNPVILGPLVAMVGAQLAMVAVMTMTPVQLHEHGQGLDVVGWVLSAHLIGMFALAPLSGWITDRWGGRATIFGGIGTLTVAAVTAIGAPDSHHVGIPVAMFLLGYGWNLVFVGGSGLLSRDLPPAQRARAQGTVDAFVWGTSAAASLLAGQLFGLGGYVLVAVAGGLCALAPLAVLGRRVAVAEPVEKAGLR